LQHFYDTQGMTVKMVHVQVADGAMVLADPTLETAWLMELQQSTGYPHAMVVYIDFAAENSADSGYPASIEIIKITL
jgi:patatin-like phospholipase/acyl hydrolase